MVVSSGLRANHETRICLVKGIFDLDGSADEWNDEGRVASSTSKAFG